MGVKRLFPAKMADIITLAKRSLFTSNFKFYFAMKIGFTNGYLPVSFSKSFVEFLQFNKNRSSNNTDPVISIQLSKLFSQAFQKINGVQGIPISNEPTTSKRTSTDNVKLAVTCLNTFLRDYETHEAALNAVRNYDDSTESEHCAVLATHLFSHLVPGEKVTVNKSMKYKLLGCPCGCPRKISFGNTGIGKKEVWHGFPDLMVEHTSVVIKPKLSDENGSSDSDSNDDGDALPTKSRIESMDFTCQLTSQTITNAFAQRRATGKSHFYSSIGCSLDELTVMFYDPEHDILLRRIHSLSLFKNSKLCLPSVVEVWFVLNLHLFNSEVETDYLDRLGTSGVKSFFCERGVLQLYEEAVTGASKKQLATESFAIEGKDIYDVFSFEIID